MGEQNSSLKRVEDQLEMVREATDRNTLEQQELLEDLKAVGQQGERFCALCPGPAGRLSPGQRDSLTCQHRRVLP